MTKNDISTRIAKDIGILQTDAKWIVQMVLDGIIDVLAAEGRYELRGFGVFSVKTRRPRKARNPRTGQEVMVGERKYVTFKPGKVMEEKALGQNGIVQTENTEAASQKAN